MLSKYAHKIRLKKNTYAIFNSIFFSPIIATNEETNQIWNNQLDTFSKKNLKMLYNKGILIKNSEQDTLVEMALRETANNTKNETSLLYMIPSSGCNLACKYCFIGKISNKIISMSQSTADITIKKFVAHLKETFQKKGRIIFYGGEPTLNFSIIEYISQILEKKYKFPIELSIVTNATILTDHIIDFCEKKNISLGISLDGPKESNDFNRVFKDGNKSTYDLVLSIISKIQKTTIDFGLSVTLSEEVLDDTYFIQWLKELNVKNINFNLLHYTQPTNNWKKYYKKASRFLFNAYDTLSPLNIRDDRILRKFRSFHGEQFKYDDCGAIGAQQLTIKPNGELTICHGYWNSNKEDCGNINKNSFNDVFQTEIYKKWKHNLTLNKKNCLKCPAIYICGGGCALQAEALFGNQCKIDKPFCIHTKYTLKELLKRSIPKAIKLVNYD